MVDLVPVRDTNARVIFQEFPGMGGIACFLVFVQDDLLFRVHKPGSVAPHPAFASGWTPVFVHEDWCFIRLDHMVLVQVPVEIVIHDCKAAFPQTDHPVRHVLPGDGKPIAFKLLFQPVERHGIDIFAVYNGCRKRRGNGPFCRNRLRCGVPLLPPLQGK